jgi:flagellar basal-body rod protein FlgB
MSDSYLFDNAMRTLEKATGVTARRHSLIAGNIANLDTVGFTPRDLDFKKTLAAEMSRQNEKLARTNERHFAVGPSGSLSSDTYIKRDPFYPEPVNIDTEMGHLVENNIKYRTSVEMLKRKINILKQAIAEGGK